MYQQKLRNILFGLVLMFGLTVATSVSAEERTTSSTGNDLEQVIRQYIMDHPEVIMESLEKFQEEQQAAERQRSQEALVARQAELYEDPTSPVLGAKKDTIDVIEFFDYRCGYCKRVHATVFKLPEQYPKVRLIFKEFPILGPDSELAARAALAAHRQGAYLPFHQALMGAKQPITTTLIDQVSETLSLDLQQLHEDMKSPDIQETLDHNRDVALAIGVKSTPTFVIGNQVIPGAMDAAAFDRLIAQATAEKTFTTVVSPDP